MTQDRKGVLSEATQILLEWQKGREQGLNGWSAGPGRGRQRWTDYWEKAVGTSSRGKDRGKDSIRNKLGGRWRRFGHGHVKWLLQESKQKAAKCNSADLFTLAGHPPPT